MDQIIGLFILVILFGAVLSIILLSLAGYVDLKNIGSSVEINWKPLLIGLFITILVVSIIVALTVLFNERLCLL